MFETKPSKIIYTIISWIFINMGDLTLLLRKISFQTKAKCTTSCAFSEYELFVLR